MNGQRVSVQPIQGQRVSVQPLNGQPIFAQAMPVDQYGTQQNMAGYPAFGDPVQVDANMYPSAPVDPINRRA